MASVADLGPVDILTVNSAVIGPRTSVTLGSSPATLTDKCSTRIAVMISVGTVTNIEHSQDGGIFDSVGALGGMVLLNPNEQLKITFVVAPTVIFHPK